jgi:sugar/nucleoside kinase (ribokinase family)
VKDRIITHFSACARLMLGRVLVSIGSLVLDLTIAPAGQLRLDDDQEASISLAGGGQAANFCAWAAALGERARLITRIGDDDVGRRLVAEIESGGVEVKAVVGPGRTDTVAVLVGSDGGRSFARQLDTSRMLRAEDLDADWLEGARLLHLPGYSLFWEPIAGAARRAAAWAREQGAVVSVDLSSPAGIEEYGPARLAYDLARLHPEVLFATEAEASALGAPLDGLAKVAVLKRGARGVLVFGRSVPAPRVEVVDGTGAGDAFAAAFCVAYVDGATPLEAAGRAVLVSARAVGQPGARP